MELRLSQDSDAVCWEELAIVIERAPLGTREPGRVEAAFRNSQARCFAYDGDRLVGAARALTDGVTCAAIFDMVVLPEYQGQGIGRRIMEYLMAVSGVEKFILYAAPGKEGFYRKLGYRKMRTAMALFPNEEEKIERGFVE